MAKLNSCSMHRIPNTLTLACSYRVSSVNYSVIQYISQLKYIDRTSPVAWHLRITIVCILGGGGEEEGWWWREEVRMSVGRCERLVVEAVEGSPLVHLLLGGLARAGCPLVLPRHRVEE